MADSISPISATPLDDQAQVSVNQVINDQTSATPFATSGSDVLSSLASRQDLSNIVSSLTESPATSVSAISNPTSIDINQYQNPTTTYTLQNPNSGSVTPESIPTFPNILNKYANYTYHLRFSVGDERQAPTVKMDQVRNMKKSIISESGLTSKNTAKYYITKFNFRNTVSPQHKTQNMNVMEFNMTITETFGLTLPDFIMNCAQEMGVKNIKRFVYFIELWFVGYDDEGNIKEIDDTYKAWRVTILDMALQTTQSGTTYEITGIADNEINNINQYAMTKSNLRLEGLTTLDSFRSKLEEELNNDEKKAENRPQRPLVEYKIKLPDFMKDWKLLASDIDKQPARSYGEKKGTIDLEISRGQDLGNFILQTISKCTEEFLQFMKANSKDTGLAKFFMVIPTIEFGDYETEYNDYKRIITFQIHPYYTPKVAIDQQTAKEQLKKQTQMNKFQIWRQHNMLAKKYEYIYTGKNTEVIRFDINVANFWAINIPSYLGTNTYGQATQGAKVDPDSSAFKNQAPQAVAYYNTAQSVAATAAAALDLVTGATGGSIVNVDNFYNLLGSLSPSSGSIVTQLYSALANGATFTNMGNTLTNISSGVLANLTSNGKQSINDYLQLSSLTATPIAPFDGNQQNFTDTLALSSANQAAQRETPLPILAQEAFAQNKDGYISITQLPVDSDEPLPVSFFYDNKPTTQQLVFGGGERKNLANNNAQTNQGLPDSQSSISNMIFNIYDKKNFIEITLEIRGDPWWIGKTNIEVTDYIKSYTGQSDSIQPNKDKYFTDYIQGDNTFLLTFNTGNDYDEDTGLMNVSQGNLTFNGIYAVIEVNNTFENGSFTQTLTAYKDIFSQKIDRDLTPTATSSPNMVKM